MKASMCQVDAHPTPPPPGRIQRSKYMDYWKNVEESKVDDDDRLRNLKQKRVFGTRRNTNIVVNPKSEKKPIRKSQAESVLKSPKQPKSTERTPRVESVEQDESQKDGVLIDGAAEENLPVSPEMIENVEGSEEPKENEKDEDKPVGEIEVKPKKKKSVGFQEKVAEEELASAPRTPVQLSSSLRKPRRSGTPYHTAHNCKRCMNDKLESSSYWIEQIKLAESFGKHFVSAAFFNLAHECNAEPLRNLKMELKRYLARHENLGKQNEWIDALRNYGLPVPKDDDDDKNGVKMIDSSNLINLEDEPNVANLQQP